MKKSVGPAVLATALLTTLAAVAEERKALSADDFGRVALVAIRALKAAQPAAAAKLTELAVSRDDTAAKARLVYAEGSGDKRVDFQCGWKTDAKPAALECVPTERLRPERPAEAAALASWDDRQRELTAEDCGSAASVAVSTLKKWKAEAASGLVRYTLERSKYSAHVKFVYAEDGRERMKAYHCHWHGTGKAAELDCH